MPIRKFIALSMLAVTAASAVQGVSAAPPSASPAPAVKTTTTRTTTSHPVIKTTTTKTTTTTKVSSSGWSARIKAPYRAWLPSMPPHVVLLCVHGLGFSSSSYTGFGRVMASQGVAVYAIDVRGFGEWMNSHENHVDFEACISDIERALETLHKFYPNTSVFLVGESMGGAIAMAATSRYPKLVDGLISSVPSSDRFGKVKSTFLVGAHWLSNKDKPISIGPEVVNRATANEALRHKWEAEKTNRMELTPRELKQFEDFMKGNYDAAALIEKAPVLMMAGFKDKLVKPEGTIELFNSVSSQDKLLMGLGDGEHLLLEENQLTEQLRNLILVWIRNEASSPHPGVTAHP